MKIKKRIRISNIIIVICCLIFFLVFSLFRYYKKMVNTKLIEVANFTIEKYISAFLSNNIGYNVIKDYDLEKIINLEKNSSGEILFISYNLKETYKVLDVLTNEINNRIRELENGSIAINDKNIICINNYLVMQLPLFIASDYIFLANLGPKVYLPINFSNIVLTNLKTKVREYGMNNALLEVYVTIKISTEVFSPVTNEKKDIYYDALISLNVVNGRVPAFYTGSDNKSNVFSIPIN